MDKTIKDNLMWIIVIIVIGCIIYFIYQFNFPITENVVDNTNRQIIDENIDKIISERSIELFFYDIEKNCTLDGKVFVGENYLGETRDGIFMLNKTEYLNKFFDNVEISIEGISSSCFRNDANLPFLEIWNVPELDYYFENDKQVVFEAESNLRRPSYYGEMMGFVRPEEAKNYLNKNIAKYFKANKYEENLDRISEYSIRYRSDLLVFGEGEYWQTPAETLNRGHGDCEDWAVTTLSIMRAYNSSLECYNSLWPTHMSIICFIDNSMIIYDQGNIKYKATISPRLNEQEKKFKVRDARNKYFDEYGLEPGERMLYALFNEKELITFETEEDFVDWVANK